MGNLKIIQGIFFVASFTIFRKPKIIIVIYFFSSIKKLLKILNEKNTEIQFV